MIVAAGLPPPFGPRRPITRNPNDDGMTGCWMGASAGSPRNSRNHDTPSPFTMWSASIMCWMPGIAATCPPTTTVECGECSRTRRHISRTLPTFTMMPEMPTMSYC